MLSRLVTPRGLAYISVQGLEADRGAAASGRVGGAPHLGRSGDSVCYPICTPETPCPVRIGVGPGWRGRRRRGARAGVHLRVREHPDHGGGLGAAAAAGGGGRRRGGQRGGRAAAAGSKVGQGGVGMLASCRAVRHTVVAGRDVHVIQFASAYARRCTPARHAGNRDRRGPRCPHAPTTQVRHCVAVLSGRGRPGAQGGRPSRSWGRGHCAVVGELLEGTGGGTRVQGRYWVSTWTAACPFIGHGDEAYRG